MDDITVRFIEDIDPNFKSSFVRNVACGDNTSFWHDPWCMNHMVLMKAFPRIGGIRLVVELLMIFHLLSLLLVTHPCPPSGCDKWFWTYDFLDLFKARSLSKIIQNKSLNTHGLGIHQIMEFNDSKKVDEEVNHALLAFSHVLLVWSWWSLAPSVSFSSFSIGDVACGNLTISGDSAIAKILYGVFQIGIWVLWNWRNRVVNALLDKIDK
nr:hypothetical protein [Tanacetum cinerariifolium]